MKIDLFPTILIASSGIGFMLGYIFFCYKLLKGMIKKMEWDMGKDNEELRKEYSK